MSRELTSLFLIAINFSLAAAPLSFNFSFIGFVDSGLLCFEVPSGLCLGVEVLPGVTLFLSNAFIAPEAIVVLIDSNSIESISNVLSVNESTIVMSLDTSATVLYTSLGFGLYENDLK